MKSFFSAIDQLVFQTYFDVIHGYSGEGEHFDEIVPENSYPEKYRDLLINATSEEPLFYTLYTDSSRIKAIAEKYPENFIITNEMVINLANFRGDLWGYLSDLIDDTLESNKSSIRLNTIYQELKNGLVHEYSPWEETLKDEILKFLNILGKDSEVLRYKNTDYRIEFISSVGAGLLSGANLSEESSLNIVPLSTISLERALKKIFLTLSKSEMNIDRVVRELVKLPELIADFEITTRGDNNDFISAVKKLSFFTYSETSNTIALQDEKFKAVYKDLTNTSSIKVAEPHANYTIENNGGVFSLLFTGQKFIIPNAVQYVGVRPLLYLSAAVDLETYTKKFYNPSPDFWLEPHQIVYSFLYDGTNDKLDKYQLVKEWLSENTSPRFHYCNKEEAEKLRDELIWAYPTVFNYKNNPDNPAIFSIEKQLRLIHGKE